MRSGNEAMSWVRMLLIGLVLTCGAIWCVDATGGGKRYGPLTCSACRLANPQADDATVAFLAVWERLVAATPAFWTQMIVYPGDAVVVCNGKACVSYTKTDSGQYMGATPVPQSPGPGFVNRGVGGGSGGGGGGSTSRPPGGGGSIGTCVTRCKGTVTVGEAR